MAKIHVLADESLGGVKRECVGVIKRYDFGEVEEFEPTDIVHIDGERFRLVDRKAEVGERVIIVNADDLNNEGYGVGDIYEGVSSWEFGRDNKGGIDTNCGVSLFHEEYHVLVPVESEQTMDKPESLHDIIANLVKRVAELEHENKSLVRQYAIDKLSEEVEELEERIQRNFNGIKDDIETWSREIETIKHAQNKPQTITIDVDAFVKLIGGER